MLTDKCSPLIALLLALAPYPVLAAGTATIWLERQGIAGEGPNPYATRFPPVGTINGDLTKIENINPGLTVHLPKQGENYQRLSER